MKDIPSREEKIGELIRINEIKAEERKKFAALIKQAVNKGSRTVQEFVERANEKRRLIPTPMQIRYIMAYWKTGSRWVAYHAAGYQNLEGMPEQLARRSLYRVHNAKAVQFLLRLIMYRALQEVQVTANDLARMALSAYENADTVKDQIAALKLLTDIVPLVDK